MNKRLIFSALAAVALGLVAFKNSEMGGRYFEISKNLEIFTNVFKELNAGYVDELDPGKLMRTGVDAMMESLDPYTNYISATQPAAHQ